MPAGAAVTPSRGPTVLGWAMLALLLLALSTLWGVRVVPSGELGPRRGPQWVWGAAGQGQGQPRLLSRSRRDDSGHQPSATIATPGHGHAATALPTGDETDHPEPNLLPGSVPPPAPSTNASLHRALVVPTTAYPPDETDSPDPDLLASSAPPPAPSTHLLRALVVPTTAYPPDETDSPDPDLLASSEVPPAPSTSLLRALVVPTTAYPPDETDSPDPDLLASSEAPPAPSTSLLRALVVPTTTDPQDETESPDPLPSSVPPASPGSSANLHRALAVPTAADLQDETESPDPDLALSSVPPAEPSTRAAPRKSISPSPRWLSTSDTPRALGATTTGPAPWHTSPQGTAGPDPWDLDRVMGKCLLAMLLLGLVAATFMVCTGVLGARLWRRARTAQHRLSPTEMICISSLLPDGEVPTNGPRPTPARRHKLLLDGGFEADGDNLTLSSFLPEHA